VPFTGGSPTAIMLKHLQQPAPSVLDERKDLPPAIARVVARALEKAPADRYQTAGELIEDFTIAAGMEPAGVSASGSQPALEPPPVPLAADEVDEETVVRRRATRPMVPPIPTFDRSSAAPSMVVPLPGQASPSIASFNPWKILIPSVIGLLVIFGVIYALSREPQPTGAAPSGSPLAADPNSSPVEPAKPPTGESEAGIPSGGSTNQTSNTTLNANTSATPEHGASPADVIDINANENTNVNSNTKKPLPSPTRSIEEEPPPPLPTATNPPVPKPSVAPTKASTPEVP
jgi:serine/threonine-protein kinase